MKIVLNIGHGGKDQGAETLDHKLTELRFNQTILGPAIVEELLNLDHEVISFSQKEAFWEVAKKCNELNPDIVLSLHSNCFNGKASGTETLYYAKSTRSKRLATCLQQRIVNTLWLPDRGLRPLYKGDRGFNLVYYTKMPAVILEPFFIDNPNDLVVVQSKVKQLALAISLGVTDYQHG